MRLKMEPKQVQELPKKNFSMKLEDLLKPEELVALRTTRSSDAVQKRSTTTEILRTGETRENNEGTTTTMGSGDWEHKTTGEIAAQIK